jgi:acetyl-CoA carboxylase biotin carboxyl carrier protein
VTAEESRDPCSTLEAISRTTTHLAATLGGVMRSIRVQSGATWVEVTWQEEPAQPDPHSRVTTNVKDMSQAPLAEVCYVCSPMVGAFYHAPEPTSPPFVRVGDAVAAGQQVGIIEAMKLMNPVEADHAGRVIEILVPNGAPVEYGERLLALAPLQSP